MMINILRFFKMENSLLVNFDTYVFNKKFMPTVKVYCA